MRDESQDAQFLGVMTLTFGVLLFVPSLIVYLLADDETEPPSQYVRQAPPPAWAAPPAFHCLTSKTICLCATSAATCEDRRSELASRDDAPTDCLGSPRDICISPTEGPE